MTSRPVELLLSLDRSGPRTLAGQIEDGVRAAIRSGALRPGGLVPSTRDLAQQLGVSRPLVVEAYAQLAAEGYLALRQGARPRVAAQASSDQATLPPPPPAAPPRYDLRPVMPDLASFPRAAWLKALRAALAEMQVEDFGYDGRHGAELLRRTLADYLGRVRGLVADPGRVTVVSGFSQARSLICRALFASGVRRVAVENPSYGEWEAVRHAGLEVTPVDVDDQGIRVCDLARTEAQAVLVSPAHQYPTGVTLSGPRRIELLDWLRRRDAVAVEDDYDAEYRYDRAPVGALQGLDPDRVIYIGTTSKTLAPALRIGWLVAPERWLGPIRAEQRMADSGCPRIDQHALALLIAGGEFDRHLRRMRARYSARRAAMLQALAEELPQLQVTGISAGLHAAVRLPQDIDVAAVEAEAARRGVALEAVFYVGRPGPPMLLLGYGRSPESAIRAGVRALRSAIEAARP